MNKKNRQGDITTSIVDCFPITVTTHLFVVFLNSDCSDPYTGCA